MKKYRNQIIKKPEKLSSYLFYQPFLLLIIGITGIIYNFGMLASPYFEGRLIDGIQDKESLNSIYILIGIFILTIFVVQVARILKRYFVRRLANNATYTMRLNVYNNILNLDSKDLDNADVGLLLSRAISDVHNSVESIRKFTTEIYDTCFLFLFYAIYLILFDYQMTLYAFIPVTISILVAFIMRKAIFSATSQSRKANGRLSGNTFDLFDNAITYRIYGRDQDNLKKYDETLTSYEKKTLKASLLTDTMIPLANAIALIGLIPIIFLGLQHVSNGDNLFAPIPKIMNETWTIGQFSTYLSTFVLMASKASHTAKLFSAIEKGLASWKRIQPTMKPYKGYPSLETVSFSPDLEVKDLSVIVDNKPLFSNLSFKASKGQIIGITGPIASGKSALGKVFIKKLDYQGKVMLFGKELKDYSLPEISGSVTYMGHKSDLLTETIKENIAFGESRDVIPYLKAVSFEPDMDSMPLRENTLVGNEGVKLSGGQQERIALARTIYHKKNLIILDDPFASVDPQTEKEILASLKKDFLGTIVLLISHRLTSFSDIDSVIVINGDGTVSVGRHADLLKSSKVYQNLYQLQSYSGEVSHHE